MINTFGTNKVTSRYLSLCAVVPSKDTWKITALIVEVMNAVGIIFIFAIMIEEGCKGAYFLYYFDGNIPCGGIDERNGHYLFLAIRRAVLYSCIDRKSVLNLAMVAIQMYR